MEYQFSNDLKSVIEILHLSELTLANALNCEQATINKYINSAINTEPSKDILENYYNFSFKKNIQLERLKNLLYKDNNIVNNHELLFHSSKNGIEGKLDLDKGRKNKDFGIGFYVGDNYEQAVTYISNYYNSSLYYIDFEGMHAEHKKKSCTNTRL